MYRPRLQLGLCLVLVAAASTVATAQPDPYDIGIAFDQAGTLYCGVVPGFAAPTRLYFLMLNLGEQIVGYEASISISGLGSAGWIITRGSPVGLDLDPDPDGYVVGIGVCVGTPGAAYIINTYDFAYFTTPQGPSNTLVCAGPPTVANPSIPGFPSYQTCAGELGAAGLYPAIYYSPDIPDGCAIINSSGPGPCIVPTENSSWASIKSTFPG